jgi:transcriptional regulator with XRE-family HTH domain
MLRDLIESRELTQSDVAAGAGLGDSAISKILAGKRKVGVKHIDRLAQFLKVEPAFFLDDWGTSECRFL